MYGLAVLGPDVLSALAAGSALAVACALLSVFVVARRWAFIGEGISHSGFGGAGTAWLLALLVPALDRPWVPYVAVVLFCLGTALAIGFVSRGQRTSMDAVVGIFLVASLAWGLLGQQVYFHVRHAMPQGYDTFLFGRWSGPLETPYVVTAVAASAAVVLVLAALGKEVVAYCLDPVTAQASGVRVGLIHYLLVTLVAVTIVIGVRMIGSLLVTALLVLPGATAMLLSTRLRAVLAVSLAAGLVAAVGGLLTYARWPFVPAGPAVVLILFAQFVLAYGWTKVRGGE